MRAAIDQFWVVNKRVHGYIRDAACLASFLNGTNLYPSLLARTVVEMCSKEIYLMASGK